MTGPARRRGGLGMLAGAAALAVLAGCTPTPGPGGTGATGGTAGLVHASPDGDGDCSAASPCGFEDALDRAGSGGVVELAAGDYGSFELTGRGGFADYGEPVVVTPAEGAVASFDRLETSVPNVVWRGVRVTGVWMIDGPAVGTRVESAHVEGTGLFVRSSDVSVVDSLFEGGSSVDGIQIGGAERVLIEGNTVRDYDQAKDNGLHADCIQIFDSDDVTIRGNRLGNCYNAGLIVSPGRRTGSDGILIESNFIQGCVVKSDACRGGSATDLREPTVHNLTVRNNTFLDGSVRVDPLVGLVFDRNVVAYISTCDAPITNSIVLKWNAKMCETPAMLGVDGNRAGEVAVVDQAGGDLHPVDPAAVRIEPAGAFEPAATTIDGTPMDPAVAGAAG